MPGRHHAKTPIHQKLKLLEKSLSELSRVKTESLRTEDELKHAEERYRMLLANAPIMLFAMDQEGVFTLSEGKGLEALGLKPGEVVGQSVFKLYRDEPVIIDNVLRVLAGEAVEECVEIHSGPGAGRVFETRYTPLKNPKGEVTGLIGVATDITERKEAEAKLQYLAYHDSLTGLPNRMLFDDRLSVALASARRHQDTLAILCLDLDQFKTINDSLGHSVGDRFLKEVAGRLKKRLREGDTIARLGGDEFILLLPQIGEAENVIRIAERIFEEMKPPFRYGGQEFHMTTSIGIALYPYDGKDSESLFKSADMALYRAKEEGRNNFQFFTPSMNLVAHERLVFENHLRRALEKNQFVVYYQPQIDAHTGKMIGMETLLRWQHPEFGLILPKAFISFAEDTALILPLGEWVLRTACAQAKAWQDQGFPPLRVAVNLSARQFQQPDLINLVSQILEETKLDPVYLELEITEGIAMRKVEFTRMLLQRFQEMGIRIAIDDFGTGYSSLGYLKKFPIHTLKLDRSFVHDLENDASNAAIAKAIISLAHSLNMKVLAEGVETEEQMNFLKQHACDMIQGNYFSRPLPKDEFEKLLSSF